MQDDWRSTDLERWAARIGSTLARAGRGPWIAVAHSFGVLALARHLAEQPPAPLVAALLVALADPDKFGVAETLPTRRLPLASTMVLSRTDPGLGLSAGPPGRHAGAAMWWILATRGTSTAAQVIAACPLRRAG